MTPIAKDETAGAWMRRSLPPRIDRLQGDIALVRSTPEAQAVHRLRGTIREIRVLLRLAASWDKKQARQVDKGLPAFTRCTSRLRDLDVLQKRLRDRGSIAADELVGVRTAEEARAVAWLSWHQQDVLGRLRGLARFEDNGVSSCPIERFHSKALLRSERRLRKRWTKASKDFTGRRSHRLRRAARDHRILLELAGATKGLSNLKRLHKTLGAYQDARVARRLLLHADRSSPALIRATVAARYEHKRAKRDAREFVRASAGLERLLPAASALARPTSM